MAAFISIPLLVGTIRLSDAFSEHKGAQKLIHDFLTAIILYEILIINVRTSSCYVSLNCDCSQQTL